MERHQSGFGCKYTSKRLPVELVYCETFLDKSSALKREKHIKKHTT
jgi:putative endonuclease